MPPRSIPYLRTIGSVDAQQVSPLFDEVSFLPAGGAHLGDDMDSHQMISGWLALNESVSVRVGSRVVAIFVGLATIACDGLVAILRRSFRWPLPKLPEPKV
jgi:hypothetical protein